MKQTQQQLENKKKWRRTHPQKANELSRRAQLKYQAKLKRKIYDHYGRVCACCGETEELFLTIGHVGGWGAKHRKDLNRGRGGDTIAVWRDIVKCGFPGNIRIECANCNFGAARNDDVCPHKTATLKPWPRSRYQRILISSSAENN